MWESCSLCQKAALGNCKADIPDDNKQVGGVVYLQHEEIDLNTGNFEEVCEETVGQHVQATVDVST